MATQRVADMSIEELRSFIRREIQAYPVVWTPPRDPRTPQEILDDIDRNMWTPPPGSPSALEVLLDERDRRSQA